MAHLLRAGDLSPEDVDAVVARAGELATGAAPAARRFGLTTLFMSASTRTRIGFQTAASRLGGWYTAVDELRFDPSMSTSESFADATRTLAGMCDVLVVRGPLDLTKELPDDLPTTVVNGGDAVEHPTQGLIDLTAIRTFAGHESGLRVGLCGDLTMRAARSLLALLGRSLPCEVRLIHPRERVAEVPAPLAPVTTTAGPTELSGLDVLVMVGLPPGGPGGRLGDEDRAPYVLDAAALRQLPGSAVVLSPLPVIDEIAADARTDSRVRVFDQSDLGVAVRMAVLERVLRGATGE